MVIQLLFTKIRRAIYTQVTVKIVPQKNWKTAGWIIL